MKIYKIIAASALAGSLLTVGAAAQADQLKHRHLHEGRSVQTRDQTNYNVEHAVPVRPGPPGSGLCNTIQIAAGNCHYPSH